MKRALAFAAVLALSSRAGADQALQTNLNAAGFRVYNPHAPTLGNDVLRLQDVAVGNCIIQATGVNGSFTCASITGFSATTPLVLTGSVLTLSIDSSLAVNAGVLQRPALTGAITATAGSNTTAFGALAAYSVLANATGSSAVPSALAAGSDGIVLGRFSSALTFHQLVEGDVSNLTTDLAGKVPTTRTISTTSPLAGGGALSSDLTLSIDPATTSTPGSLSAADKTKLDSLTSGAAVASVGATAPVTSTGGTTPVVGLSVDSTLVAGSTLGRAAITSDVGIPSGSNVATIQPNVVSNAKGAQMAALTVKANATNATANAQDVAATAGGQVFQSNAGGTALSWGLLGSSSVTASPLGIGYFDAAGKLTDDPSNASWDPVNFRAGFRVATPSYQLHLVDQAGASDRGIMLGGHGSADQLLSCRRSLGTLASPTAVSNTTYLCRQQAWAYDGAAYQQTGEAGFRVRPGAFVSAGAVPTDWFADVANTGATGAYESTGHQLGLRVTRAGTVSSAPKVAVAVNPVTMPSLTGTLTLASTGNSLPLHLVNTSATGYSSIAWSHNYSISAFDQALAVAQDGTTWFQGPSNGSTKSIYIFDESSTGSTQGRVGLVEIGGLGILAGDPVAYPSGTVNGVVEITAKAGATTANAIALSGTWDQKILKMGTGKLQLGTSIASQVDLLANGSIAMTLTAGDKVQIPDLAAGGYAKAAVTTGQLSVVSTVPWTDISGAPTFLADPGSNGLVARTASGTTAARTLTAGDTTVTVTNGNGVSGNPTIVGNYQAGTGIGISGNTISATGTGLVPTTRTISTTAPLTGGGDLSANRTFALSIDSTLAVAAGALGRAALTGDATSAAGSNAVTLAASGVTAGSCTYCSVTFDAKGRATAQSSGTPVTSVSGTAGQISSTGGTTPTLALTATTVTAGSYTNTNLTVDANGRITSASNGSSGGSGTITAVTASSPLASSGGTAPNITLGAISGDGSISAGSSTFTLTNVPNDTVHAGDILVTNTATPATPSAGHARCFVDSTSTNWVCLNSGAIRNHGVQTTAGGAHLWISAITDAGAPTLSRPDYSDLTGTPTWPAANDVVLSTGTGPTGSANLTFVSNSLILPSSNAGIAIALNQAATQNINKNGGTFQVGTGDANALNLYTNGTVRATIDSSGNVRLLHYGAGILATDASGNVNARTLTSAGTITVTNGTGASGNPSVDLPAVWAGGTLGGIAGSAVSSITVDAQGRSSGAVVTKLSPSMFKWSVNTTGFSASGVEENGKVVIIPADSGAESTSAVLVTVTGGQTVPTVIGAFVPDPMLVFYPIESDYGGGGVFTWVASYIQGTGSGTANVEASVWMTTAYNGTYTQLCSSTNTSSTGNNFGSPHTCSFATPVPANYLLFVAIRRTDANAAFTMGRLALNATLELSK